MSAKDERWRLIVGQWSAAQLRGELSPPLECPRCGHALPNWTGKCGSCGHPTGGALLVLLLPLRIALLLALVAALTWGVASVFRLR